MQHTIKKRPKIPRNKYGYLTGKSTGNVTEIDEGIFIGSGDGTGNLEGHYIWGQYFNGKQDITGDFTSEGKVSAQTIEAPTLKGNDIYPKTGNQVTVDGILYVDDDSTVNGDLFVSGVTTLDDTTSTRNILPQTDITYDCGAGDRRWKKLFAQNGFFHNLEVTGTLDVFELQIDRVRAVGGRMILSDASMTVYDVEDLDGGYTLNPDGSWSYEQTGYEVEAVRLYAKSDDENKAIQNEFAVNDLIICQSFNIREGVYQNVTNKYFRSTVLACGYDDLGIFIDISKGNTADLTLVEGTVNPEKGDDIVQLGNRVNTARQSAIILSAYNDSYLDPGITAPSFVQYSGIDEFDIVDKRVTVISPTQNLFTGDMSVVAGGNLDNYINSKIAESNPELHTYYAYNTQASDTGCVFTDSDTMTYIGIQVSVSQTQPSTGYKWMKKGDTTTFYDFVPTVTDFYVNASKKYSVTLSGVLYMYSGSEVTKMTSTPSGYEVGYFYKGQLQSLTPETLTPNSNGVYTYTISNQDYTANTPTSIDFGLYKMSGQMLRPTYTMYDGVNVPAKMLPSAVFTVTDNAITAAVADSKEYTDGQIVTLEGRITVEAERVKAEVIEGLTSTGIDITSHNIKVTADNFEIDNNSGTKTFGVDAQGQLIALGSNTTDYMDRKIIISPSGQSIKMKQSNGQTEGTDSEGNVFTLTNPGSNGAILKMYSNDSSITIDGGGITLGNWISMVGESGSISCNAVTTGGLDTKSIAASELKFTNIPVVSTLEDTDTGWYKVNKSDSVYKSLETGQLFYVNNPMFGGKVLMIK